MVGFQLKLTPPTAVLGICGPLRHVESVAVADPDVHRQLGGDQTLHAGVDAQRIRVGVQRRAGLVVVVDDLAWRRCRAPSWAGTATTRAGRSGGTADCRSPERRQLEVVDAEEVADVERQPPAAGRQVDAHADLVGVAIEVVGSLRVGRLRRADVVVEERRSCTAARRRTSPARRRRRRTGGAATSVVSVVRYST